ncbi:hypothetical protein [Microbacterium sp. K24]|uniref:hypothetical protein n=1 Tax=Microbacterium sp. K24 TaxID=2305446 RepID=UPI00109C9041|nr:hypothetical protein [Microbacterium sp. K24]
MANEEIKYEHLVNTYAAQQSNVVEALLRVLLQIWLPFSWWGRPDMVNAAAAASAVQVDVATRRARRLSRAFMLRQLELIGAMPDSLPPIVDSYERGGTPIVEVYKRPARQLEHKIRQVHTSPETGKLDWPDRVSDDEWKSFTDRLTSIVTDDLAATARDEAQKVMWASPKVIGYRRVIHPEFSKTGTCGLCVVASSRFYSKSELMPLHDLCKCTISPLTADRDLGLQLNAADLARIYEAAGSNYAEDLKRIKVQVREHGELGPILTRRGDAFRTVSKVNRDSKRQKYTPYKRMEADDQRQMWEAHRATSERSIRILQDAKDRGTNLLDITGGDKPIPVKDIDKAIAWHRSLIARALANLS